MIAARAAKFFRRVKFVFETTPWAMAL